MKFSLTETIQAAPKDQLLPDGNYPAHVIQAEDTISKASGNEMIKLKIRINHNNLSYMVWDYLIATMPSKLESFCNATNQADKFASQELLAINCEDKLITVSIITQKDKDGRYPDKNSVKDYIVQTTQPDDKKVEFLDDDIPF